MQRKTKASIAVLLLSIVALAITISFLFINIASPLGIWIEVGVFCKETKLPVPDGLAITCDGMGYETTTYTKGGLVKFGSGLIDGTYTISWYWNELYSYDVTINCSQITWHFDYYVPNPTITKHFYYDAKYFEYPPIVGCLEVSLYEGEIFIAALKTDGTGTVVFGGQYVNVCKDYYLKWTWGGKDYTEGPIHFAYNDYGELLVCVWEEDNFLPPNSGGGKSTLGRRAWVVPCSCHQVIEK